MVQILLLYVKSALASVTFLASPLLYGGLAVAALVLLALRIFIRGIVGWVLRTVLYVGIFIATLHYGPFRVLYPDVATPFRMSGLGLAEFLRSLAAGNRPGFAAAIVLIVGLWLGVTILGLILRRVLVGGAEVVPAAYAAQPAGAAVPGQAFDIRRRDEEQKQIICIMMTDIAGYSAKMEKDEAATYALLKEHNTIMRRNITTNRGREIKTIGDAFMVVFNNPLDALRCGIGMQKDLHAYNKPKPDHEKLKVRVGIHRGEVIVTAKDVFGEGVNIAARMESITDPGGISISSDIFEAVKNKVEAGFLDIGTPKMKNIANPPKVYRVQLAHQ